MTPLAVAAKEAFDCLAAHGFRGCLIGGVAVQRWGEPRLTQDVDVTVLAEVETAERIVDALLSTFAARQHDARAFALRFSVLLLRARNGVPLDVALGATPFEAECIDRATACEIEPGCVVPTCTAEDLIIHKVVAGRPRDLADIEGIVTRQLGQIDVRRIRRWLRVFAAVKEDPSLAQAFERALKQARALARHGRKQW